LQAKINKSEYLAGEQNSSIVKNLLKEDPRMLTYEKCRILNGPDHFNDQVE